MELTAILTGRKAPGKEVGTREDAAFIERYGAADTVGQLMRRLGQDRQVMAVTHLAQVAACAHQHLVVAKSVQSGQTTSDIRAVRDAERIHEVARMLGGAITDTSRAHAEAMLHHASQDAKPARRRKDATA